MAGWGLVAGVSGFVAVPERYDLAATLGPLQLGRRDPATRVTADMAWRATRTPEGPGTASYRHHPAERLVAVEAWGPGAAWLVEHAADLLGAVDDVSGVAALLAEHPLLARLHRKHVGVRIGRSLAVFEALVLAVCAQKVTGLEAKRSWRGIVERWGEPAPGPAGLRVPPSPATLSAVGYHGLHRLGVERRRAETIRAVARHAAGLERIVTDGRADAERRLRSVPGVGVWTAAEVRRMALGDADAVSYGDYHLPHLVSWSLLGRRRGSDELLAELLAPYAPHRGRVVRLLELGGRLPERRGPRLAPAGHQGR